MAKISNIFKEETRKADLHPKRVTHWIHYTKLKDNPAQYRYGKTVQEREELKVEIRRKEEALADLIEADGEVIQDLLVRKIDTDEYEIIAGHHRRNACKILVEERNQESYAMLPCIIRNLSDVRSEFTCYSSNGYAAKTDYEIMCELEGMSHLLRTYPEEFPNLPTGRLADKLAAQLQMSKSTIGEYRTIANNLGETGMQAFQAGKLKKSAAVELATLPEEEQEELLKQGIVSHKGIKAYKKSKDVPKSGTMELPLLQFETEQEWKDFLLQYPSWTIVNKNKMTEEILYEYRLINGTRILVREFPYTSGEETISCQEWYLWRPEIRHFRNARVSLEDVIDYMRNENE